MSDRARIFAGAELALAGLTVATVVSFVRLFTGFSFLWPLLTVALATHLVAAATRRLRWPAAAALPVSIAAGFVALAATRYRPQTWLGLPTPSVVSHLHRDLQHAATAFRNVTAPTAPLPGFVVVLATLVVLVAVAGDALAFRLGARAEAVIPAAGCFLLGAILGGDRSRIVVTALFVAAALAFVLLHRTAMATTAAVRGRTPTDAHRGTLRTGALLIVATCLVGAAAAGAAPRQHASPWTRWRGPNDAGGTRVTVSPLVNLRDRLVNQTDVLLFKVRASQPAYWRLTALDQFSDDTWSASNSFDKARGNVDTPDEAPRTTSLRQQFSLIDLAQVWAPAAYQPARVTGTDKLLYDAHSGTLIVTRDRPTSDQLTYTVTSNIASITAADLTRTGPKMSADDLAHYTELPGDLPDDVRSTARDVVAAAGATTEYAKALALQNWLRTNFTYTLQADYSKTNGSVVEAFLHRREGWCEQFAGAYAVMARSLGMPTRLAVGFTPGRADPAAPGTFDVYGRQAHAWPEVWFPNQGWVAFEPTPGRGAPGDTAYTGIPFEQDVGPAGQPATNGTPAATPAPSPQTTPTTQAPSGTSGATGGAAGTSGGSGGGPARTATASKHGTSAWAVVVLVAGTVLVLLVGLVVALFALRWWLRTRRRRSARTSADQIDAAWNEACDSIGLLDVAVAASDTRLEHAVRAARSVPATAATMHDLAELASVAQWAPTAPDPSDAGRADAMAADVEREVRRELGGWRYAVATIDPRHLKEMARRR